MTIYVPDDVLFWLACVGGPLLYLLLGSAVAGVMTRLYGPADDRAIEAMVLVGWPIVALCLLSVAALTALSCVALAPFVWLGRKIGGL